MQKRGTPTSENKMQIHKHPKSLTQILTSNSIETSKQSVSMPSTPQGRSWKYFHTGNNVKNLVKTPSASDFKTQLKQLGYKSTTTTTKSPAKNSEGSTQIHNLESERRATPNSSNPTTINPDNATNTLTNKPEVKASFYSTYSTSLSRTNSTTRAEPRPKTSMNKNKSENELFRANRSKSIRNTSSPSVTDSRSNSLPKKRIDKDLNLSLSNLNGCKEIKNLNGSAINGSRIEFLYNWLFFGPHIPYKKVLNHLASVYEGLSYITYSLSQPSIEFIQSKQIPLPPRLSGKKKTLILDLDETLVHSCQIYDRPDVIIEVRISETGTSSVPLKIRPYIDDFFKKVSPYYEIIIFTAATRAYAHAAVELLDNEHKYISYILAREDCMQTQNGFYIKDLRILKDRDPAELVIVDNLIHSFGFQVYNGIPILEYIDDEKDEELLYLADYLLKAKDEKDIRVFNKERLLLDKMLQKSFDSICKEVFTTFNDHFTSKSLAEI